MGQAQIIDTTNEGYWAALHGDCREDWHSYDCFCRAEEQAAEAEQTLDIARAMADGELTALNLARLDHLLRLVERNIKSIAALSRRGVALETPKLGAMQ